MLHDRQKNSNLKFVACCLLNLKLFHILKKKIAFPRIWKKEKKNYGGKKFSNSDCVYTMFLWIPFFCFLLGCLSEAPLQILTLRLGDCWPTSFFCVCLCVSKEKIQDSFFLSNKKFCSSTEKKNNKSLSRCIVYKHILLAFKSSWPTFFFIIAWLVLLFFCASSSYFAVRWNFIMSRWNDFFFFSPVREKRKYMNVCVLTLYYFFFSSPSSLFPLIM